MNNAERKAKSIIKKAALIEKRAVDRRAVSALETLARAEATARKLSDAGTPYSNRELDAKFIDLGDKIDEHHDDLVKTLEELNRKVGIQNGRVSKLEGWRGMLIGGGVVLSLIVIPALAFLAIQVLSDGQVLAGIQAQLSAVIRSTTTKTP